MATYGNLWKLMETYENLCQFMATYDNFAVSFLLSEQYRFFSMLTPTCGGQTGNEEWEMGRNSDSIQMEESSAKCICNMHWKGCIIWGPESQDDPLYIFGHSAGAKFKPSDQSISLKYE